MLSHQYLKFYAATLSSSALFSFGVKYPNTAIGILFGLFKYVFTAFSLVFKLCGKYLFVIFEFCVILLQNAQKPHLAEADAPQGAVREKIKCRTGKSYET